MRALLLTVGALATAWVGAALVTPARADDPPPQLRSVTPAAEMDGRQAQRPLWAPGSVPRLVHESTDRDTQAVLRVVAWDDGIQTYVVPGSRSSRLGSLGAGRARSDTGASWWDAASFYFLRSSGQTAELHVFDGTARHVPDAPGRVDEVVVSQTTGRLFAALERDGRVDVWTFDGADFASSSRRLSSDTAVEHSLVLDADGNLVFVSSSREGTWIVRTAVRAEGRRPRRLQVPDREVLSVAPVPGEAAVVAYARSCADPPECSEWSHVLLEQPLDDGRARVLVRDAFVPPGLAPRPALSDDGRFLYFVAADSEAANPVVRFDRQTGESEIVPTGTRGNQEVAVAEYPDIEGNRVPWLAVVAIGDEAGTDVRNHLYVGPLADWSGWEGAR